MHLPQDHPGKDEPWGARELLRKQAIRDKDLRVW